jgi:hypothetical protein
VRGATLERVQDDLWLNVTLSVQGSEETLRWLFEPQFEQALRALLAQI